MLYRNAPDDYQARTNLASGATLLCADLCAELGLVGAPLCTILGPLIASGQPISRSQIGAFDVQIGMLGPLIAVVLMRRWVSKESLGRSLHGTRSWRAYLFAVLVPTGLVAATILINAGIGLGRFRWAGDSVLTMLLASVLILPLATISAIGEEYGWRGYLLPRLLHGNAISASIAMGLIWGLWHLPLLITGLSVPDQPIALVIPVFLFAIVMLSFLFTSAAGIWGQSVDRSTPARDLECAHRAHIHEPVS